MKIHLPIGMVLVPLFLLLAGQTEAKEYAPQREQSFDADWSFLRDDAPGAEQPAFDDSSWRHLDLPHDWSIEDLPSASNALPVLPITRGVWRFSRGDQSGWAATNFDDSRWQAVHLPAYWNDHSGYTNENCFGWYRRRITVPEALRGRDFRLSVGVVDDTDETFFNGRRIGGIGGMPPAFDAEPQPWTKPRIYPVPASLVVPGENVVAVRVFNRGGQGGLYEEAGAVTGPFSPASAGGAATGYTVGDTGWYRKHFVLAEASAGRVISVLFDGVYMNADVWLNGRHLGNHPYGYTSFAGQTHLNILWIDAE